MKNKVELKAFYQGVFALVIPMALQNLINVGVTAADVMMLGRVGEKVLSGASLAGQVQFVMTLIFFGITSGITVLTAQYWGKKDTRTIEKILGMGVTLAVSVGLLFALGAIFIPEKLMHLYTTDPEVIAEGAKYLRIIAPSYVLMAITQVYLNVMRSVERVVIATVTYSISLGVNIGINAVLIFGLLGFPQMAVRGAAIGTLIARFVELLIVFCYARFKNHMIKLRLKNCIHFNPLLWKDFLVYAGPVIINELLWGLGYSTNSAIIGHLGSAAVAANAVAQVMRQFSMVVVFGVCSATAIYLGKTIGAGKYELAKEYSKRFLGLSTAMGVVSALVIIVISPVVQIFMTLSPQAISYLKFMTFAVAGYAAAMSVTSTLIVGVFRAGGDTRFSLMVDALSMWAFSIPLGAIAAFVLHMNVEVVYTILLCDELVKIPITVKHFFGFKWLKNVTRELTD